MKGIWETGLSTLPRSRGELMIFRKTPSPSSGHVQSVFNEVLVIEYL